MKVVFFGCEPDHIEFLNRRIAERGIEIEAIYAGDRVSEVSQDIAKDADVVSVFVGSPILASDFDRFSNIKLITTRSTGYDHIDTEEAKKRGIPVAYVPSYGENTVAEHAFGLLLALSKRIYDGFEQIREQGDFRWGTMKGFDLKGKTLGVLGMGRIGFHAATIGNGFGMRVIAHDRMPNEERAKQGNFKYVSFDELLAQSDVITIHVSFNDTTEHLINEEAFAKMKKGAVIINTSRGGVIDTKALLAALQSGHLGGAGLDVLEEEGVVKDEMQFLLSNDAHEYDLKTVLANHVLVDMPNVIVTPHIAFNTKEAVERILETTLDNIEGFIRGDIKNLIPTS
jgi:D-lactate dehydrogenase